MYWNLYLTLFVLLFENLLNDAYGRPHLASHLIFNKTKERYNSTKGTISFSDYSEQVIVFPDSEESSGLEPVPRIDGFPKCANGETFCEQFDPYPTEHLKEILQKNNSYQHFWGKDEVSEVSQRDNGEEDLFVCGSFERVILPKIGLNKNKKWKYIINQEDDGFEQGVRIETCRNHGGPCNIVELPNGYVSMCKQKYTYRRLLSINDNGSVMVDSFLLPSACCCSYRKTFDFLARVRQTFTPAKIKR